MSSKTFLVAQRELLENVRTKGFWIGILLVPILLVAFMVVPAWLESKKDVRTYAVIDHSGWLLQKVEERAAMPDLSKVFRKALDLYRNDADEFAKLPPELQEITRGLEEIVSLADEKLAELSLEEGEITRDELERNVMSATAAAVSLDMDALPAGASFLITDEVREALRREVAPLRESIRLWWRALPPREAAELSGGLDKTRYRRIEIDANDPNLIETLNQKILDDELFAYFVINADPVASAEGSRYVAMNVTDEDLLRWFRELASDEIRERRLAQESIDRETAQWIQEPLKFQPRTLSETGEEEEVEAEDKARNFAPMVYAYILWMSVFTIAQMLMTNTIEEKSTRVIEVLLSSVSPLQLMAGKILGIAATGLTMIAAWVVAFLGIFKLLPDLLGLNMPVDLISIATDATFLTSFVVYFVLGYLFLAAALVAVGSTCNTLKEAQNLMAPVTMFLMVPLLAIFFIAQDPNSTLAKVLSYIPPFTPFVMMNRAAGPPTTFEYVTTTALLVVSLVVMFWAAAKIFRIGILMSGKAPTPLEILRWLRTPVGQVPQAKRDPAAPRDPTETT